MNHLLRTDSDNPEFIRLVHLLDADLAERDGAEHLFYNQYNSIARLRHAVVAYSGELPAGCGAMKEVAPGTMEIKRMYTLPDHRGKGIATSILAELEAWAASIGYTTCVLETGKRQPEAISLYEGRGYHLIPNYGQYAGVENSVCFEKTLRQ